MCAQGRHAFTSAPSAVTPGFVRSPYFDMREEEIKINPHHYTKEEEEEVSINYLHSCAQEEYDTINSVITTIFLLLVLLCKHNNLTKML